MIESGSELDKFLEGLCDKSGVYGGCTKHDEENPTQECTSCRICVKHDLKMELINAIGRDMEKGRILCRHLDRNLENIEKSRNKAVMDFLNKI
jgi:hypothetical protein